VFVELLGFWRYLARAQPKTSVAARAQAEVLLIEGRIQGAFETLRTVAFTPEGRLLVEHLARRSEYV
jgi:hypothetical protein